MNKSNGNAKRDAVIQSVHHPRQVLLDGADTYCQQSAFWYLCSGHVSLAKVCPAAIQCQVLVCVFINF